MAIKWPVPLWRLRGYATLPVGPHWFRFHDLQPEHYVFALLANSRQYESGVVDFLTRELRPGDVFADVGAHMGFFALLASRLVGPEGRVYAFEPDPVSKGLLHRNLASSGVDNVEVLPVAVAGSGGTAHLAGGVGDAVSSLGDDGLEVQTVTLDGFCRRRGIQPAVVKIDVEGAEGLVLDGGGRTLSSARAAIVEIHGPRLKHPERVLDRLRALGPTTELDRRYGAIDDGNWNVAVTPG